MYSTYLPLFIQQYVRKYISTSDFYSPDRHKHLIKKRVPDIIKVARANVTSTYIISTLHYMYVLPGSTIYTRPVPPH